VFLNQTAPDLYGVMAAWVFLMNVPQISNSAEPRKDMEPRLVLRVQLRLERQENTFLPLKFVVGIAG
jgi:hypothetical protein